MTKGEYRVGIGFNPSASGLVAQIKVAASELIDLIDSIAIRADDGEWSRDRNAEVQRLKALAQTAIEEGAMWAVKAATKPAPETK